MARARIPVPPHNSTTSSHLTTGTTPDALLSSFSANASYQHPTIRPSTAEPPHLSSHLSARRHPTLQHHTRPAEQPPHCNNGALVQRLPRLHLHLRVQELQNPPLQPRRHTEQSQFTRAVVSPRERALNPRRISAASTAKHTSSTASST